LKWVFRTEQTLQNQLESLKTEENFSKRELLQRSLANTEACCRFTSRDVGNSGMARRRDIRGEYSQWPPLTEIQNFVHIAMIYLNFIVFGPIV